LKNTTKSKVTCFKRFLKCDSKVLNSFSALGASNTNIEEIAEPIYQFFSMLFGSKVEGIEATR
jgi:hypothetical protein